MFLMLSALFYYNFLFTGGLVTHCCEISRIVALEDCGEILILMANSHEAAFVPNDLEGQN